MSSKRKTTVFVFCSALWCTAQLVGFYVGGPYYAEYWKFLHFPLGEPASAAIFQGLGVHVFLISITLLYGTLFGLVALLFIGGLFTVSESNRQGFIKYLPRIGVVFASAIVLGLMYLVGETFYSEHMIYNIRVKNSSGMKIDKMLMQLERGLEYRTEFFEVDLRSPIYPGRLVPQSIALYFKDSAGTSHSITAATGLNTRRINGTITIEIGRTNGVFTANTELTNLLP